jgi:hypothetical protein
LISGADLKAFIEATVRESVRESLLQIMLATEKEVAGEDVM